MCVPWESNPQPFALLTQCSTTEPHRNGNGMGVHIATLSSNWESFKCHSVPEYCYCPCPSLYDYSVPIFWCTSSRIMHVTKLKSSQTGFLNMTMSSFYSNGLQSPDLNPIEHLWQSWMCSRQICSNCVMLSCQYGPKSLRNVCNTLLNLCHEELRQFWRNRGSNPLLAMCT